MINKLLQIFNDVNEEKTIFCGFIILFIILILLLILIFIKSFTC